jgi:hypothetical protein
LAAPQQMGSRAVFSSIELVSCNHLRAVKSAQEIRQSVAVPRYQQVHEVGSCDKSDVTLNATSFPGRASCLICNHNHHKSLLGRVTRLQAQQNFQLTNKHMDHILFSVRTHADSSCKKSGQINSITWMAGTRARIFLSLKWWLEFYFHHMQGRFLFIVRGRTSLEVHLSSHLMSIWVLNPCIRRSKRWAFCSLPNCAEVRISWIYRYIHFLILLHAMISD